MPVDGSWEGARRLLRYNQSEKRIIAFRVNSVKWREKMSLLFFWRHV